MHGTPEDFMSRGARLCMRLLAFIRMPIESASLKTRSTSFRDLTSAPIVQAAMGWQVSAEQTLISGGAGRSPLISRSLNYTLEFGVAKTL